MVAGTEDVVEDEEVADVVAGPAPGWFELQPDTTTRPVTAAARAPRTVRDTTQSVADQAT